jgi:hypothetical protein
MIHKPLWLCIIVSYAGPVVVNHGVLCWANDCHSWCVMLSQRLWFMVCYAEPVFVNNGGLCCVSGCESCCDIPSHWVDITVRMMCQCMWIMVSYAEAVVVNHGEVCWANGLWIMVCYAVPVVVNHEQLCSLSCESWWAMLRQWVIHNHWRSIAHNGTHLLAQRSHRDSQRLAQHSTTLFTTTGTSWFTMIHNQWLSIA